MAELKWSEPQWLTEDEFAAEVTDPIERWFWQAFTDWAPPDSRPADQEETQDG